MYKAVVLAILNSSGLILTELREQKDDSLAKMESKELGARKISVKESIKYISELITDLGVTGITPENLRLAKFNKLESPGCLLRALYDIVTLCNADFAVDANINKSRAPSSVSVSTPWSSYDSTRKEPVKEIVVAAWERDGEGSLDGEILADVKFHLALWGYPSHSPFFLLPAHTRESRHFLLALGWIISHCNLIERGLERRLQPLVDNRSSAPLPHKFPLDMSCSREALVRGRKAKCAVLEYVRRMIAATERVEDEVLRTEMRADQVLMLYGQVRACLNAIEAFQVAKMKKLHELQLVQLAAGVKPHTAYELHLLQHKRKLDLHCQVIAAAKAIEDEKVACEKHEDLFWQWMESIAHDALDMQAQAKSRPVQQPPVIDLTGVTEAELFPLIEHLKQKLTTSEENAGSETSSSRQYDFPPTDLTVARRVEERMLPQYAKNTAKGFLRQPVFVYNPKRKPDTQPIKTFSKTEEENDPQSASYKITRLMAVDDMVKEILAKTRAENKAIILRILQPFMADESYVVVDN